MACLPNMVDMTSIEGEATAPYQLVSAIPHGRAPLATGARWVACVRVIGLGPFRDPAIHECLAFDHEVVGRVNNFARGHGRGWAGTAGAVARVPLRGARRPDRDGASARRWSGLHGSA